MNYRWSLGTLIGFPLLVLTAILLLVLSIWLIRKSIRLTKQSSADATMVFWCGVAASVSVLLVVVGTAWGMWPYKAEYHQWRETSGVVAAIDSRLMSSGDNGGTTQRFVVTFEDKRERSCDDTRCATVKVGDILVLECQRQWQYAGTDGYNCNYVSDRRGD